MYAQYFFPTFLNYKTWAAPIFFFSGLDLKNTESTIEDVTLVLLIVLLIIYSECAFFSFPSFTYLIDF